MNSQNKPSDAVVSVFKKNGVQYIDTDFYSWPQVFGSTAGPRLGVGGCAMTSFTIEAWVNCFGEVVYTCNGMFSFEKDGFQIGKTVRSWIPLPKIEEGQV